MMNDKLRSRFRLDVVQRVFVFANAHESRQNDSFFSFVFILDWFMHQLRHNNSRGVLVTRYEHEILKKVTVLIDSEMFEIMNVRIRKIFTCLHSLSSNFDIFVKIRHNDCTIVLNFIIERNEFLNNIRIVFSFEILFNIHIYMTKEDPVFCHSVFNIVTEWILLSLCYFCGFYTELVFHSEISYIFQLS